MDRGAWQATVYGVTKVGLDLATKLLLLGSSAHEILQARIPDWVAKPGGLQSMGSQ